MSPGWVKQDCGPSGPLSSSHGGDCVGGLSVRAGSAAPGQRQARSEIVTLPHAQLSPFKRTARQDGSPCHPPFAIIVPETTHTPPTHCAMLASPEGNRPEFLKPHSATHHTRYFTCSSFSTPHAVSLTCPPGLPYPHPRPTTPSPKYSSGGLTVLTPTPPRRHGVTTTPCPFTRQTAPRPQSRNIHENTRRHNSTGSLLQKDARAAGPRNGRPAGGCTRRPYY